MVTLAELDARTPVLIGVGQAAERLDDAEYAARPAVELAAAALRHALADTGADPAAVAAAADTVASVRPFDASFPGARAPLGGSDNVPRSVAARVGATPRRAVLEVGGGQSPQHLVNEFAAAVAAGQADVVLIVSGEAISTARHLAKAEDRPDFTEHVDGDLEDRGFGLKGLVSRYVVDHGLDDAPATYALFENARRARLGQTRQEYAEHMGQLFAPFTGVAAGNPYAAAPVERSAQELVTPSEANRVIAEPYTRYLVARDQVNQAAAIVLTSLQAARRLGVPEDRMVFLHGHADLRERDLLERPDLSRGPASTAAVRHALEVAGMTLDEVSTMDLYSCFPVAVLHVAEDLGLDVDDKRGLTVSGGLPFFGGAGNGYSLHAIAETVQSVRGKPGTAGLVGANGGALSKYSVGVYSTTPRAWVPDRSEQVQDELDAVPPVPFRQRAAGWATVESWTVKHGRGGVRTGIVVGRQEDGQRFLALAEPGDEDAHRLLGEEQPVGSRVYVRSTPRGNRFTTSPERMSELFPSHPAALREEYEHVLVRRDGHLLEVTINRPEQRNALTPPANDELAEVFDAFFADPDLWVAVLTGAGDKSFSSGNDLTWTLTGQPMWVPDTGFAGLTSRRGMNKPVIAAVNGFAMGGGFEIALACHMVVADESARFALSETKVGLIAGAGGLARLPRSLPDKLALEMIVTGRRLSASEALQHGLVNRVVPEGDALEGARALAQEVLAASPTSVRLSLSAVERARTLPDVVDAVDATISEVDDLLFSQDMIEGLTAFAEKRAPRWRNR
jgi:acetyl-CoA C-acetyltransferase